MPAPTAEAWLHQYVERNGGVAGTVHVRDGDSLELVAALNIPAEVLRQIEIVPSGKGMAGLAMLRDEPVSTCNLQTDESGDVRPGARAVGASAAVAIPIHDRSGSVLGVVGIAFAAERDIDEAELERLTRAAETFGA